MELGRLPTAAELITTCAAELEALGAWDDACQALDSHARLLYRLGHAEHAAACETSIVDIVRRHGQRRDPADEWLHIARRRHARGDLPAARRAFELAERAYNTIGDADGLAGVRYDLGVLGYGDNALEQAAQDFATAAEAYARLRAGAEGPAAPRVGNEKPAALRAGAEEPAVPQAGAGVVRSLRMGSDESAVPRVEAGKPAAPQAGVKESAARRAGVKESAARTMRGVCLMELDRFDAAAAEFHRALELAAGERDLTALYSVTLAEAELAMMTGRLAEAETGLLAAPAWPPATRCARRSSESGWRGSSRTPATRRPCASRRELPRPRPATPRRHSSASGSASPSKPVATCPAPGPPLRKVSPPSPRRR